MKLDTTLSKQGGRRYPQMNDLGGAPLQRVPVNGTSATFVFNAWLTVNSNLYIGPTAPLQPYDE